MKIAIINGPNLNLLGTRQPEIYGSTTFEDHLHILKQKFKQHHISYFQTNGEGELIDAIQQMAQQNDAIILNAAAYSHSSIGIGDAVAAIDVPLIEVHISNIFARENFRHHSYISKYASGIIIGCGMDGYRLAIERLQDLSTNP